MRLARFVLVTLSLMVLTMNANAAPFMLTSASLHDGGVVPEIHVYNGFGYHGANRSPALSWSGAPAGTLSFAVTCHDPDAPHPGGWWHWLVFNIPATASGLAENASAFGLLPGAVQSVTDFGPPGYGGPAPPPGGPHRYIFTVYALNVARLDLPANTPMTKVDAAIRAHALASARLIGLFQHP